MCFHFFLCDSIIVIYVCILKSFLPPPPQVVEPDEVKQKAGLTAPHTSHCLANGQVMISAMGDTEGKAKGQ